MKITRAVLREIPLELKEFFAISSGGTKSRRIMLLTLESDGHVGWGECVAGEHPNYSYETTETTWSLLTDLLLPEVLGRDFDTAPDVLAPVDWVRGHRMAKAAIEMAAWDLEAKIRGVSLSALLGGTVDRIPVGVSIGIQDTDDALFRKIEGFMSDGYRKIKIKIKPGRDVEMLAAVRRRFPDVPMMADANSAYTLDDVGRFKEMDEVGLMMIEQPLAHDDYLDHATLQSQVTTPICLDESVRSVGDARLAYHLGSCKIINIKPGRVGGLASSKAIHDVSLEQGFPVWCGGMLESGIGRAHNAALASLEGFTIPGDISESRRYWTADIVEPEFVMTGGHMPVPQGPGIGVNPLHDKIDSLTVRSAVVEG